MLTPPKAPTTEDNDEVENILAVMDEGQVQQEVDVTSTPLTAATDDTIEVDKNESTGADTNSCAIASSTSTPLQQETEPTTLPATTVGDGVNRGQLMTPGPSSVQSKSLSPPLSTKLKLLLQGAYRRVAPEPIPCPVPTSATVHSVSSASSNFILPPRVPDPTVYAVQVVQLGSTNNNVSDITVGESSSRITCLCPTHRTGSVESYEEVCRICHDNNATVPFITPCLCKGSMGLVHQPCLERWLGESGKTTCEICGYEYVTERRPKYQGCSSLYSWIRNPIHPHDTKNLFFDVACFFVLTPLACISAWLCVVGSKHYAMSAQERFKENLNNSRWGRYRLLHDSSNSTWTSVGLLTLTGTLLTAYYIWLFVAFRYHYQVWRDWLVRNYQVTVLPVTPEAMAQFQGHNNLIQPRSSLGRLENITVINMEQGEGQESAASSSTSSGGEGPSNSSDGNGRGHVIGTDMMVNTYNNNLNLDLPEPEVTTSSQSV